MLLYRFFQHLKLENMQEEKKMTSISANGRQSLKIQMQQSSLNLVQVYTLKNETSRVCIYLILFEAESTSSSATASSRFNSSTRLLNFFTSPSYCSALLKAWPNSVVLSARIFFNLLWVCFNSVSSWDETKHYILKNR